MAESANQVFKAISARKTSELWNGGHLTEGETETRQKKKKKKVLGLLFVQGGHQVRKGTAGYKP